MASRSDSVVMYNCSRKCGTLNRHSGAWASGVQSRETRLYPATVDGSGSGRVAKTMS